MLDIPNERSSHTAPTPRGGGAVIFLISAGALFIYASLYNFRLFVPYLFGAAIISGISLLDDIKTLSPFWRILFHALAAGVAVFFYGGFTEVFIPFYQTVNLGFAGQTLTFLWIIWLINAYNFMDGIDGIAALQAVTAGIGWCLVGMIFGVNSIGFYGAVLAAASMGFLFHNWQPSRIFMGDVGSAFLGFTFAVLPLIAANDLPDKANAPILLPIAVVLVWFFIFDSLLTFFRRLFRGERVWLPHREHIYQKMVISGLPHTRVSILYGILSILLMLILVGVLNYRWNIEKTLMVAVIFESMLLAILWRIIVRRSKRTIQIS